VFVIAIRPGNPRTDLRHMLASDVRQSDARTCRRAGVPKDLQRDVSNLARNDVAASVPQDVGLGRMRDGVEGHLEESPVAVLAASVFNLANVMH